MSEKVKLPKEVCDALDFIKERHKKASEIIKAISVGYEPLESEEELYGAEVYEPYE